MIDCMHLAVIAAVAGIVEQIAPLRRLRIGDDIAVLQVIRSGANGQVIVQGGFFAKTRVMSGMKLATYQSLTFWRSSGEVSPRSSSATSVWNARVASTTILEVARRRNSELIVRK